MKNDAKLGMLAGVLGVVVAAVVLTGAPPPVAQARPDEPQAKQGAPPAATPPVAATPAASPGAAADTAALPATPVARTRKEADAQPTSRSGAADEEP